jgi:hypothetical protein
MTPNTSRLALTSGSVVALMLGAGTAQADIVVSSNFTVGSLSDHSGSLPDSFSFGINPANPDFEFAHFPNNSYSDKWPSYANGSNKLVKSGLFALAPLNYGDQIDGNSNLGTIGGYVPAAAGDTYFGLDFVFDGADHYGWLTANIEIVDDPNSGDPVDFTVTPEEWAYDTTPNETVYAGEVPTVPEPGTLSLLALGASALLAARRRKRTVLN